MYVHNLSSLPHSAHAQLTTEYFPFRMIKFNKVSKGKALVKSILMLIQNLITLNKNDDVSQGKRELGIIDSSKLLDGVPLVSRGSKN